MEPVIITVCKGVIDRFITSRNASNEDLMHHPVHARWVWAQLFLRVAVAERIDGETSNAIGTFYVGNVCT